MMVFMETKVQLKVDSGKFYIQRGSLLWDKYCPDCKRLMNSDFCRCGYDFEKAGSRFFFSYLASFWIVLALVFGILFSQLKKHNAFSNAITKINTLNISNLAPSNMQVISQLKNSPYSAYLQAVYIDDNQKNKLMILVKPNMWNILTKQEKMELLKEAYTAWEIVYQPANEYDKPKVSFANK